MNRLLAVELTNCVKKWADSRGLPIKSELQNRKDLFTDAVTYCHGVVKLPTKNIELCFDTEYHARHKTLSVRGWDSIAAAFRTSSYTILLKDLDETLDHIVKRLEELSSVTHDGLADLKLTGLPDLAHNPILATYLSDTPNKENDTWDRYRGRISKLLTSQGINSAMRPDSCYAEVDEVSDRLYCVLHHEMCGDAQLGHTYYHALIAYHQPLPSTTVSGCITYYQDDHKRQAGIRTPIKIRKYLDKFFRDAFDAGKLCKDKEYIIDAVTELLATPMDLDVRIYDDSNLDGWAEAYASTKISSCMNTTFRNYGVGTHETFRCYLTSHFTDGAFSSGLSLAVLYSVGTPVARSIVYEEDGQKYYVRNYSDDRLVRWLEMNGYERSGCIPEGTYLYTCNPDGGSDDDYICPYVDGDSSEGEPNARYEHIDGHDLWVIDPTGDYELQVTSGYRSVGDVGKCECCERRNIEHHGVLDYTNGGTIDLCEHCYDVHVYYIDCECQFCEDIYSSDLVKDSDGNWYSPTYLENTNYVMVDGRLCSHDDYFYCNYLDEYVAKSDGVDLGNAPDFIQQSWRRYIEGGLVSPDAYEYYGFELDYYSDYLIHETCITRVVLGDTHIHLADEHIDRHIATALGEGVVMPHSDLAEYDRDLYNSLVEQADNADTNPRVIIDRVFI